MDVPAGQQMVAAGELPESMRTWPAGRLADRAAEGRARPRSPGERANAHLETWRIMRKFRCCP